ncbi:DinB family protein [Anatilimnocola floriformis]|uniref:DinB family protein n=1 Tax=Anatilimnocola floriformis TaxID=2948575 RepID=UPI0020C31180|nr:DinB family protein [Anatilimnocola floriformis]
MSESELSTTIAAGFGHYFHDFARRVRTMASNLTDDQFWAKPYPYGNSFGNIVLHLIGNLSYYIGTQIEHTGYVRDRDSEFAIVQQGRKKDEILAELDETVAMVIRSLGNQADNDWSRQYVAQGVDDVPDRFSIYLRCCVHFHHHIGQMTYLMKEWAHRAT